MAGARKMDHGPVLGDDAIDEAEVAGDAAEVIENAAGHEDHVILRRRASAIALSTDGSGRSSRVIVPS